MKHRKWSPIFSVGVVSALGLASGDGFAQQQVSGPVIVDPQIEPKNIQVNQFAQPLKPNEIKVEVQDFVAEVVDVRLKLQGLPIEIPLEKVGGSTWRTQLGTSELERLVVNGRTVNYKADVIATNEEGDVSVTEKPIEMSVSAPEFKVG